MINYKASIIGFHNPKKHKGLSAEDFLNKYVESVLLGKKRNRKNRVILAGWIHNNWETQLIFVKRLFPNTLIDDEATHWYDGWIVNFRPYSSGCGKLTVRLPSIKRVFSMTFPKYKEDEIKNLGELIKFLLIKISGRKESEVIEDEPTRFQSIIR